MPPTRLSRRPTSSKKKKGRRKASAAAKQSSPGVGAPVTPPDLDEVISQADLALETSNNENAVQLYNYAAGVLRDQLKTLSSNMAASEEEKESTIIFLSKILGKMAEAKVSLGDQMGGQADFVEATTLLKGDGPSGEDYDSLVARAQWREARASLFLYLGQLSSSKDALDVFTKAIDDMKECIRLLEQVLATDGNENGSDSAMAMEDDNDNSNDSLQSALSETKRQLCGAYCSVAELYLTDLCFEPNAEAECESSLQAAVKLDDPTSSSPDAIQAMANLRLSQNRGEEAIPLMVQSYNRVKVGCEALADLVGLGKDGDENQNKQMDKENVAKELKGEALNAANSLPGFEFRCQMAKLLLECSSILEDPASVEQRNFCVEAAIQVLGSLLAENDEVIEIWFLVGCAFSTLTPKNTIASKHYFETTLDMLQKVKKGMKQQQMNPMDEEFKASLLDIQEKIKEVKKRLSELGDGEDGSAMEED